MNAVLMGLNAVNNLRNAVSGSQQQAASASSAKSFEFGSSPSFDFDNSATNMIQFGENAGSLKVIGNILADKFGFGTNAKNMLFNEYMSSTQIQRAVLDALKAGVNPVYALGGGSDAGLAASSNSGESLSRSLADLSSLKEQRRDANTISKDEKLASLTRLMSSSSAVRYFTTSQRNALSKDLTNMLRK